MVNAAPVMVSEGVEVTLSGSEILEHDGRLLPWLSTVGGARSESSWMDGEVELWTNWVGEVEVQAC